MRLVSNKLRNLAKKKGMTLSELLKKAGVSKTSYYHLTRKENLLPKSMLALARALGAQPSDFITQQDSSEKQVEELRENLDYILNKAPHVDPENAWHSLVLLKLSPWQRLDRGLLRAQKHYIHR